jgi:hypothetical protein
MKLKLVCCLLFIVSSLSLAQLSREEKLEQLKSRSDIKVTEVEPNLLKLEYPNGKMIIKNIGDYKPETNNYQLNYSPTYDSTIIDLTTIDTTLYYHKYNYWTAVPINNSVFDCLRIGDVNNNGKTELYGFRKFFWAQAEPVTIYELNNKNNFIPLYQYDSVFLARNIYDVDEDGQEEVLLTLTPIYDTVGNQQRFFSKPTETSFATQLNFTLTYYGVQPNVGAQLNDITFGDFDGDQNTDMIFAVSGYPDVHIFEYNPFINNFDSVYRFDVNEQPPWDEGGFSVSDFDLDGKTDIVFGTGKGNVFVIENEGNNQYTNSWQGSVESYSAYIHTWSNDIDKNGKPEFWVLADAYYNGIGTTRITIFETNGDNSYYAVGRVDLVGIFSFYAGTMQAVDIDNDGIEEIAICIDDNFLILKFNGSINHHTYELYYIKQNELNMQGEFQVYFGATIADLTGNAKKEYNVLISMIHIIEQPGEDLGMHITKIYRPDSTSSVLNDGLVPKTNKLFQNYPNPFNPTTTINYSIKSAGDVSLKVYDILGTEVASLVNEVKEAGNYSVSFDAANLPSGIYFYTLTTGNYLDTKKLILLK